MKTRLFIAVLLILTVSGCGDSSTAPKVTQSSDDNDIREAVYRHQFLHNASGQQQQAAVYFLAVCSLIDSTQGWRTADPSPELMLRFAGHTPPVKPWSACRSVCGDVLDTLTLARGLLFRTEAIRRITADSVEVDGGYYEGNLSASGNRYTLRRSSGIWIVVKDRMLWIS
jgi:hypothetical protein